METPEINFQEVGNSYFLDHFRSCLRGQGGVVLRGAIAPERCAFYKTMITRTHENLERLCVQNGVPLDSVGGPEAMGQGVWQNIAFNLREGQIAHDIFSQINPGFSIFDLIGSLEFAQILSAFFNGPYHRSHCAHTRRISLDESEHSMRWQKPVFFHVDGQYHTPAEFGLNFWTTLDDCGVDAPGLQIVRNPIDETLAFLEFNPATAQCNPDKFKVINEDIFSAFDEAKVFAPEMKVGDVFVIHNWTLHSSSYDPAMTKSRQSCELRINQRECTFPTG